MLGDDGIGSFLIVISATAFTKMRSFLGYGLIF